MLFGERFFTVIAWLGEALGEDVFSKWCDVFSKWISNLHKGMSEYTVIPGEESDTLRYIHYGTPSYQ